LELANIVHKKTSGHALFVVQLLNSLVRDSVLAFSPLKRRYDWDPAKVRSLKTADNVASLVVSNLNSLNAGELHTVRVLSCFGVQSKLSVLALLKDACPYGGVESYLQSLIEGGVVETKESLVIFTHDMIQQGVYNNIPTEERQRLHLTIGISLGMKVALDQHSLMGQIEEIDFERLIFVERNVETLEINNIIGIAPNQVNLVDPKSIERSHRIRFARWNMVAASQFAKTFNFGASAHYCKKGIDLLYDSLWCSETFDLCRALHEGAASASLFLCDTPEALKYANLLIDNLPFADSLAAQYIVLRAWERVGKYEEQMARGLDVLRGLKLDIPAEPSPSCIMEAMALTSNVASKYSIEQITNLMRSGNVDKRKKNVLMSLNSIVVGAVRSSSPFLPLVSCAVVNYSLQNGVYEESALSFACLAYFKLVLARNYKEARYWADATEKILSRSSTSVAASRARLFLYGFVDCWYVPLKETCSNLLSVNKSAVAMGDTESAVQSMFYSLRCSFYGGENLSLLLTSHVELLRTMVSGILMS
jgi:predicted ATPase